MVQHGKNTPDTGYHWVPEIEPFGLVESLAVIRALVCVRTHQARLHRSLGPGIGPQRNQLSGSLFPIFQ